MPSWNQIRSGVLFLAGLAGVIHETLDYHATERPLLLAVFVSMMGLPLFLHLDEKKKDDE